MWTWSSAYIKHSLGPGPVLQIGLSLYQPGFGQETEALGSDKTRDLLQGFCRTRLRELVEQSPRACCLCVWCWSFKSAKQAVRLGVKHGRIHHSCAKPGRKIAMLLANFASRNGHREFHDWGCLTWFPQTPRRSLAPKFLLEFGSDGKKEPFSFSSIISKPIIHH